MKRLSPRFPSYVLARAFVAFGVGFALAGCSHAPRPSSVSKPTPDLEDGAGIRVYSPKREVLPRGDDVALVSVAYGDIVSLNVIRETLDKAGIDYAMYSNLGLSFLVRSGDLARAKQLLRSEVRLGGRRILIAP